MGPIAHYIGVFCEYFVVILFAVLVNNMMKLPRLFIFPLMIVGIVLVIFGLFLIVWSSLLQFKIGKGTTGFSEPTKELVTSGLYGIVRNPMMIGQFLFFIGIGFLLDLLAMFLILPILIFIIHLITVYVEEPDLKRRFGKEWEIYCKNVHRWIPKFKKAKKKTNV